MVEEKKHIEDLPEDFWFILSTSWKKLPVSQFIMEVEFDEVKPWSG